MEKGRGVDKSEKENWPKCSDSVLLNRCHKDDLKKSLNNKREEEKLI